MVESLAVASRRAQPVGRSQASTAGPAILVAAVDLASGIDVLAEAIRSATAQLMSFRADSRLACVTVLKTEIIGQAPATDEEGRPTYIARLVALKEWARPLDLPEDRTSFHVLEAVSPADAVLRFAEHNAAGHIVIGARASSVLRRHLGSVSSQVVAEARCSVSVVRVQGAREAPASSGA
jgi:eukaryotic-like serine/threonine-protein kinase